MFLLKVSPPPHPPEAFPMKESAALINLKLSTMVLLNLDLGLCYPSAGVTIHVL